MNKEIVTVSVAANPFSAIPCDGIESDVVVQYRIVLDCTGESTVGRVSLIMLILESRIGVGSSYTHFECFIGPSRHSGTG